MMQRIKDFIEGWRTYRRRRQPSRTAHAFRIMSERQSIYALSRQLAEAHKQLNDGPNEGEAFVWRERLQAAEVGLRRVAKDRARLTKRVSKLYHENRVLKKTIADLMAKESQDQ